MNFMFGESCTKSETGDLEALVSTLMSATAQGKPGVKVVDLAEVPSDVLPIVVGMLARLIFTVQMWMDEESRVPIALFCDEAHLYLPNSASADSAERRSVYNFERIAKEGRKYGVALVVISQRPSEINHTILSQCGNFISMRLSNNDDQNVVKKLLPDTLAGLTDLLPVLDIGEALAVGDACLLPSRVRVHPPTMKPISTTKRFWDLWSGEAMPSGFSNAITALRRQSKDR
jgi:DNA helicase HerA-like ATPase